MDIRLYHITYDVVMLKAATQGLQNRNIRDYLGRVEVRTLFKVPKVELLPVPM